MGAAELGRLSLPPVPPVAVLCTKQLFKAAFPMHHDQKKLVRTQPKPHVLVQTPPHIWLVAAAAIAGGQDDLCGFFGVKANLRRNAHGALLDADLTAEVFHALLFCLPAS